MQVATYFIDTFTTFPFSGNPTGVCYVSDEIDVSQMLAIANEFNLPVTAFISKQPASDNSYNIRYFTPVTEIPACGHATLASARVVQLQDSHTKATFHTITDIVIETLCTDSLVVMNYPVYQMRTMKVTTQVLESLSISNYELAGYCEALETLFIVLDNPVVLRDLQPDFDRLLESNNSIKEVVVTSIADTPAHDYLLRSFCPWIGINEDPVTGSVHSVLAGFWQKRLGKHALTAFQASQRGGELLIKAFDDKVEIGGETVIVMQGALKL